MKKKLSFLMASLLAIAVVATIVNAAGVIPDGTWLHSIMDFLSIGGAGAVLAFPSPVTPDDAGHKAPEEEHLDPDGNPAVSKMVDANGNIIESEVLDSTLSGKFALLRPQSTPIDTITRNIKNNVKADKWQIGGFELGTREVIDEVAADATGGSNAITVTVKNPDMWLVTDIVKFVDPNNGPIVDSNGNEVSGVITAKSGYNLTINRAGASTSAAFPATIEEDTELHRLSNAVRETRASVPSFNMEPDERGYFCQTHMKIVEQSLIFDMLKKKTNWNFLTKKEQELWDLKRAMELSNIFGDGGYARDEDGKLVHLATGIWNQINNEYEFDYAVTPSNTMWNAFGHYVFGNNDGADERFLFAGPDLIQYIAQFSSYSKQLEAKSSEIVAGLKVNRIETPEGVLLVKPLNSLMKGYYSKCGFVLDTDYLYKYILEPFQAKQLKLDEAGISRSKSVRFLETYGLFLGNLPAHCKITPKP